MDFLRKCRGVKEACNFGVGNGLEVAPFSAKKSFFLLKRRKALNRYGKWPKAEKMIICSANR